MTDLGKLPLGKFAHLGKYSWESCPGKVFLGKYLTSLEVGSRKSKQLLSTTSI